MEHDTYGYQSLVDHMQDLGSGTFQSRIPQSWRQGRTAYGGLTSGLAVSAAQIAFSELPPLRSMQMTFVGPVVDDPVFTARLLRQGRNVTSVNVEAQCGEANVAMATFMFGAERMSDLSAQSQAPDTPKPEMCESFHPEGFNPEFAKFVLNFDLRLIAGHRPLVGAEDGYIRVWARHRDENSQHGTGSFLTLGDVLPPAAMTMLTELSAVSSMNWQMNILEPDIGTTDGWWHIESRQTAASSGYSSQVMRFWNSDGVLVAEGLQSVAVFA